MNKQINEQINELILKNSKNSYKQLCNIIAAGSINDPENYTNSFLYEKYFVSLCGYLVVIDALENKELANYDPIVNKDNGNQLLINLGHHMINCTEETLESMKDYMKLICKTLVFNMVDYYKAQANFDIEDEINAFKEDRKSPEYKSSIMEE